MLPKIGDAESLVIHAAASSSTGFGARARHTVHPPPKSIDPVKASPRRNYTSVASLLRGVVDGSVSASQFARVLDERTGDTDWKVALGVALRELGYLIEASKSIELQRQKALTVTAMRAAQQRLDELEEMTVERNELRGRLAKSDAEVARLRDQLDFHSMSSTGPHTRCKPTPCTLHSVHC